MFLRITFKHTFKIDLRYFLFKVFLLEIFLLEELEIHLSRSSIKNILNNFLTF